MDQGRHPAGGPVRLARLARLGAGLRELVLLGAGLFGLGLVAGVCAAQDGPPAASADADAASADEDAAHAEKAPAPAVAPADRVLELEVDGRARRALLHVPPAPREAPAGGWPVVVALHGAAMNGPMMAWFSGLSATADAEGFVVVYPDGTGRGPFLVWNAGGFGEAAGRPDDVAFIDRLLDAVAETVPTDAGRIYACGMSNGGMMCYRLATELPGRFAAIGPVAGTNMRPDARPERPVPLIHFHGTADSIVPFGPEVGAAGDDEAAAPRAGRRGPRLPGVARSVTSWAEWAGCHDGPVEETLSPDGDPLPVTRLRWRGDDGREVELVRIEGGGHTWPGQKPPVGFIGKSTTTVSANDLLWEFFSRHERP